MGFDEVTGALSTKGRQLKFATFPYGGVNYQTAKRKILFVGLDIYPTSQQATKSKNHGAGENPLTYVSLSNFFKFVEIGREFRSGDSDRNYINKEAERRLFIDEIKKLEPDIIVFQGNSPAVDVISELKKLNIVVYKAPHPSNRNPGGRQPENYVKNLKEF